MIFPSDIIAIDGGCIVYLRKNKSRHGAANTPVMHRGNVKYEGKTWTAARLAYHLNVASIPRLSASRTDGHVLHHCDQKHCINPEHLYLGTARENVHDIIERNPEAMAKRRGRRVSDDTRAKISASLIGNKRTLGYRPKPESIAKMAAKLKGRQFTDEHRGKIQAACREHHARRRVAKLAKQADGREQASLLNLRTLEHRS